MAQYIDKSALVAEIERLKERLIAFHHRDLNDWPLDNYGKMRAYNKVLSFIDTIEVKEVDLENETTHYLLHEHHSPLNEIMHKADLKSEMQYHKDIENAFKAGFELGMQVSNKAQKGE